MADPTPATTNPTAGIFLSISRTSVAAALGYLVGKVGLSVHTITDLAPYTGIVGTAMLGEAYGVIKRATVVRTGKRVEIVDDAETLRLLIINNPGFTLTLECCFDVGISPPGLMDAFTIPYIGVTGRVMEGTTLMWEEGGERGLSIPVAQ